MSEVQILVLKFGALGDVIRTSYILPGLYERFGAGTVITWVTAPAALPLLRFNPFVTNLISADRCRGDRLPEELNGVEFDWVISLDDERESCGLATRVRAGKISGAFVEGDRIGYSDDTQPWFDMGLISRFGKERADALKIENERSHDEIFAGMLQIPIERPHFFGNPRSEEQARAILGAFDRVKVGLNPSAGTRWPSKSLRLAEAIRLVDALKRHGVTCLLLGGRDDAEYLEKLASATGAPVINNLPLAVFAGVIRGLDLLTTSDTLALHLAIAQAVPNLSYYAPTSAAEINTFGTGSKVASTSADYCSYKPDADNSTITAGRLLPEALKLLTIPSARPHR